MYNSAMIVGHGIDLVEVAEIELQAAIAGWLERAFSAGELNNIPNGINRAAYIASRFAAKEAVMKALGSGFGNGVAFSDIIIVSVEGGPPAVNFVGGALSAAESRGVKEIKLSLSHTKHWACASAIALGD